jgi:hypothetical protein
MLDGQSSVLRLESLRLPWGGQHRWSNARMVLTSVMIVMRGTGAPKTWCSGHCLVRPGATTWSSGRHRKWTSRGCRPPDRKDPGATGESWRGRRSVNIWFIRRQGVPARSGRSTCGWRGREWNMTPNVTWRCNCGMTNNAGKVAMDVATRIHSNERKVTLFLRAVWVCRCLFAFCVARRVWDGLLVK